MKKISVLLALFLVFLLPNNSHTANLLDDFSDAHLDPGKWQGRYWEGEGLEQVRMISGGKLVSKIRGPADNRLRLHQNKVPFVNPNNISSMSAKVAIIDAQDSGDIEIVASWLEGFFYNDSAESVWAGLCLEYDASGYYAHAHVLSRSGFDQVIYFNMNIIKGHEYNLSINWDQNNKFTFTVMDGNITENHIIIGPANQGVSTSEYKALVTSYQLAENGSAGVGSMHATFDDVYINGLLYDNFSTVKLNPSKWRSDEVVREIRNGKVQFNLANNGMTEKSQLDLILDEAYSSDLFKADVTFASGNSFGAGTYGYIRLTKDGYYSAKPPGNDEDGAIYGNVVIEQRPGNQFSPKVALWYCNDSVCNSTVDIFSQRFASCNVQPDLPLQVSIERVDKKYIFKCGQDTITYTLNRAVYNKTFKPWNVIRSRVYSPSGNPGYLNATIDNVYSASNNNSFVSGILLPVLLSN